MYLYYQQEVLKIKSQFIRAAVPDFGLLPWHQPLQRYWKEFLAAKERQVPGQKSVGVSAVPSCGSEGHQAPTAVSSLLNSAGHSGLERGWRGVKWDMI